MLRFSFDLVLFTLKSDVRPCCCCCVYRSFTLFARKSSLCHHTTIHPLFSWCLLELSTYEYLWAILNNAAKNILVNGMPNQVLYTSFWDVIYTGEGSASSFILQVEEQDQRREWTCQVTQAISGRVGGWGRLLTILFFKGSFIYL